MVSIPVNGEWITACSLRPDGPITSLSWSFRGDLLSCTSNNISIWNLETNSTGLIWCDTYKPLWSVTETAGKGKLSPDGRLLATSHDNDVKIWYRTGDSLAEEHKSPSLTTDCLKYVTLNHSVHVHNFHWIDQPVKLMYIGEYMRNTLLVEQES